MAARLCILVLLLAPGALCALEFDFAARRPARLLFANDSAGEPEKPAAGSFSRFALGSVGSVYPYQSYHDQQPSGELRDFMPALWLEVHAASLVSRGRVGASVDTRLQALLLLEIGGMARLWPAASDDNRVQHYGFWIGGNLPLPEGSASVTVSAGIGAGFLRKGSSDSHFGFLVSTRILAFPLWPLSFSADITFTEMGRDRTFDLGAGLGVMVFRHLFAEVSYRGILIPGRDFASHGLSAGLSFYWRINRVRGAFAAPDRRNTW